MLRMMQRQVTSLRPPLAAQRDQNAKSLTRRSYLYWRPACRVKKKNFKKKLEEDRSKFLTQKNHQIRRPTHYAPMRLKTLRTSLSSRPYSPYSWGFMPVIQHGDLATRTSAPATSGLTNAIKALSRPELVASLVMMTITN